MFCHKCGNKLPEGAASCIGCGAKIQADASAVCTSCGAGLPVGTELCINCGTAANPTLSGPMESQTTASAPPQGGARLVGFSDRYNAPEILAAAQKNKKYSIGCM